MLAQHTQGGWCAICSSHNVQRVSFFLGGGGCCADKLPLLSQLDLRWCGLFLQFCLHYASHLREPVVALINGTSHHTQSSLSVNWSTQSAFCIFAIMKQMNSSAHKGCSVLFVVSRKSPMNHHFFWFSVTDWYCTDLSFYDSVLYMSTTTFGILCKRESCVSYCCFKQLPCFVYWHCKR